MLGVQGKDRGYGQIIPEGSAWPACWFVGWLVVVPARMLRLLRKSVPRCGKALHLLDIFHALLLKGLHALDTWRCAPAGENQTLPVTREQLRYGVLDLCRGEDGCPASRSHFC